MNDYTLYGLIGKKLGHSFSAEFFRNYFAVRNIRARYVNFEIDDISEIIPLIESHPELHGLNVTIPYKEEVIPLLATLTPAAEEAGAVNVIRIERGAGKTCLHGYNSDIFGFSSAFESLIRKTDGPALILGTGGASKATDYALRKIFNRQVHFVSREKNRGDFTYRELTGEIIRNHKIIVNTTPLGMFPDVACCPDIPYKKIGDGHVCLDLVYNPEITEFARRCEENGAEVKTGTDMLRMQAIKSYEFWTE